MSYPYPFQYLNYAYWRLGKRRPTRYSVQWQVTEDGGMTERDATTLQRAYDLAIEMNGVVFERIGLTLTTNVDDVPMWGWDDEIELDI